MLGPFLSCRFITTNFNWLKLGIQPLSTLVTNPELFMHTVHVWDKPSVDGKHTYIVPWCLTRYSESSISWGNAGLRVTCKKTWTVSYRWIFCPHIVGYYTLPIDHHYRQYSTLHYKNTCFWQCTGKFETYQPQHWCLVSPESSGKHKSPLSLLKLTRSWLNKPTF